MSFEPRIFISSTFDLIKIRKKISDFFKSIGGNPLLYEENLTPSVNNSTYRKDILNADFAIFIFDKRYGSSTNTGLSGTHEEWLIANKNKIPSHVYIKFDDGTSKEVKLKEFITNEIDSNFVSYYFFKDEKDLLKRLKETSLIIAYDIILSQIEKSKLDKTVVRKLSTNADFEEALPFLKTMEEVLHLHYVDSAFEITRTTLLINILEIWESYYNRKPQMFIDGKFNELFINIFECYNKILKYHSSVLHASDSREVYLKSMDTKIQYAWLVPANPNVSMDYSRIRNEYNDLIKVINDFKEEVLRKKNNLDLFY